MKNTDRELAEENRRGTLSAAVPGKDSLRGDI